MTAVLDFEPITHAYFLDRRPVPGVTDILRDGGLIKIADWADAEAKLLKEMGYSDAHLVPSEILRMALARGRRVHAAVHFLADNDLDWDSVEDTDRGYVEGAAAFFADAKVEMLRDADGRPLGREVRVYSSRFRYAGTVDLIAKRDGNRWTLCDYKCGEPEDVAADLQLAAYENAVRELGIIPTLPPTAPILRTSVKLHKNGTYRIEPYDDPKHARDFSVFLSALTLYNHKRSRRSA